MAKPRNPRGAERSRWRRSAGITVNVTSGLSALIPRRAVAVEVRVANPERDADPSARQVAGRFVIAPPHARSRVGLAVGVHRQRLGLVEGVAGQRAVLLVAQLDGDAAV